MADPERASEEALIRLEYGRRVGQQVLTLMGRVEGAPPAAGLAAGCAGIGWLERHWHTGGRFQANPEELEDLHRRTAQWVQQQMASWPVGVRVAVAGVLWGQGLRVALRAAFESPDAAVLGPAALELWNLAETLTAGLEGGAAAE